MERKFPIKVLGRDKMGADFVPETWKMNHISNEKEKNVRRQGSYPG